MDDSYSRASAEYERMEPRDNVSQAVNDYHDTLSSKEQAEVCLEYLEAKQLYVDFEDFRSEQVVKREWLEDVVIYCESSQAFWEWLG